jgi:endonuclease III
VSPAPRPDVTEAAGRLRAVRDALRVAYGRPIPRPHHAPLDELVLTVLSQNTNDRNRDVAWARLRQRFPSWEEVRRAPEDEVEEAIRPGGISRIKARRIIQILDALDGDDLAWLETAPLEQARAHLLALPGVGRKTAACVLLFSFNRPEVPVDTHVHRVSARLGLVRAGASFDEAHDVMLAIAPPEDAYEVHVSLIRHGRRTCVARAPRCADCPVLELCPHGRARLAGGA